MYTISLREISLGLFGAWRLAHLDARGMEYFDRSIEGFWRSFWAAAVTAPAYALIVALRLIERSTESDPLRVVLVETIGYAILWTAFPLASWYLLQALDKQDRYFGYIVAYNWASVLQVCVYLPVAALAASGGMPEAAMSLIALAATAVVVFYQYFIARTALQVDMPIAAGIVFLDLMLGILVQGVIITLEMR
jgi:hypothetical protein